MVDPQDESTPCTMVPSQVDKGSYPKPRSTLYEFLRMADSSCLPCYSQIVGATQCKLAYRSLVPLVVYSHEGSHLLLQDPD